MPSVGAPVTTYWDTLLEEARPELYRRNGFRILKLAAGAPEQAIDRICREHACARWARLTIPGMPDADVERTASLRLRNSDLRLVDEIFWFWSADHEGTAVDPGLSAALNGEFDKARKLWSTREKKAASDYVLSHNLAVLTHLSALEAEPCSGSNGGAKPAPQRTGKHGARWSEAYCRWQQLLGHSNFWRYVEQRVAAVIGASAPAVRRRTEQIQGTMPRALLLINARLAARLGSEGDLDAVRHHLDIMRACGFSGDAIHHACQQAAAHLREAVKTLCSMSKAEVDANPAHGDWAVRQLLEQCGPLLRTIDLLLPDGELLRRTAHDAVAIQALIGQVAFGRKTKNWKVSLALLEEARAVVAGPSVRRRVEDNVRAVQSNLEWGTCWFCQSEPLAEDCAVPLKMYGDVRRTPTYLGVEITWRHGTIKVPRCRSCQSIHKRKENGGVCGFFLGAVVGGVLGFLVLAALGHEAPKDAGCWIVGMSAFFAGLLGALIGAKAGNRRDVRPASAANQFPEVKKLLSEGWKFGEKPTE